MSYREGDLIRVTLPGAEAQEGVCLTDEEGGTLVVAVRTPHGGVHLLGLVSADLLEARQPAQAGHAPQDTTQPPTPPPAGT